MAAMETSLWIQNSIGDAGAAFFASLTENIIGILLLLGLIFISLAVLFMPGGPWGINSFNFPIVTVLLGPFGVASVMLALGFSEYVSVMAFMLILAIASIWFCSQKRSKPATVVVVVVALVSIGLFVLGAISGSESEELALLLRSAVAPANVIVEWINGL